jgi:hypothetical protein
MERKKKKKIVFGKPSTTRSAIAADQTRMTVGGCGGFFPLRFVFRKTRKLGHPQGSDGPRGVFGLSSSRNIPSPCTPSGKNGSLRAPVHMHGTYHTCTCTCTRCACVPYARGCVCVATVWRPCTCTRSSLCHLVECVPTTIRYTGRIHSTTPSPVLTVTS